MRNYKIGLFGSAGVRTMEINENFMSDDFALNYVERSLRYYYPVFYNAAVWRLDDEGNGTLLAEFSSAVSVTMKRRRADMTIKEAVINYLNEQSTASDFSLGDVAGYAESLVREAVLEWADENGYDFDEFTSVWYKPDVPAHAPLNK